MSPECHSLFSPRAAPARPTGWEILKAGVGHARANLLRYLQSLEKSDLAGGTDFSELKIILKLSRGNCTKIEIISQ